MQQPNKISNSKYESGHIFNYASNQIIANNFHNFKHMPPQCSNIELNVPSVPNDCNNFLYNSHSLNDPSKAPLNINGLKSKVPCHPSVTEHVPYQNGQVFANMNNNYHSNTRPLMPSQLQPTGYAQTNYKPMFNIPPPPIRPREHAIVDSTQNYSNPIQCVQNFNFPPHFVPPTAPYFPQGCDTNLPSFVNSHQQQNFSSQVQAPLPNIQYSFPKQSATTSEIISSMQSKSEPSAKIISQNENLLDVFLQKFHPKKKDKAMLKITIPEFRSTLKVAFALSKMLQSSRQDLLTLLRSKTEEWKTKTEQIVEIQNKLSEACAKLSNPNNLCTIQKKLKVIRRKRELKKRSKRNALCEKVKKEQERERFHLEIDKWLDNLKEKNEKLKREIEMKKEADNILSEVRRKIHETKKTIEKLKVFEKLRSARQANAVQKGLYIGQDHAVKFEKKITMLRQIMQEQLSSYEKEEKALQVMLETEQEDRLEEEAIWRRKKMMTFQQKKQNNILECLFGFSEEPEQDDPLFLFYQFHNSGDSSIDSLVQIRHHWDMHLSEMGESIPQEWVVPVAPSSPAWEAVCSS
ncbi:uncharacterized protein NPIL_237261 [Nephila pilipes]|uniref:Programmed cell death protein 7 n=1 Tax=Nephila pilipes TaxID=299642 RepID=A0A8X6NXS3_NEPPI|nr:uncharacterized protein NPIL_237261 [Nephila pilipes]